MVVVCVFSNKWYIVMWLMCLFIKHIHNIKPKRCLLLYLGQSNHDWYHCWLSLLCLISVPCQNGGTCLDEVGDYSCLCVDGFSGKHCEVSLIRKLEFVLMSSWTLCLMWQVCMVNFGFGCSVGHLVTFKDVVIWAASTKVGYSWFCINVSFVCIRTSWIFVRLFSGRHRRMLVESLLQRCHMQPVCQLVHLHLSSGILGYQLFDQWSGLHGQLLYERRHVCRRHQYVHLHLSWRVSVTRI